MPILSFDLTLSPPAGSFERIEEMQEQEVQPDIQELVEFLEHDPVTVVHLLRQVNSQAYSLRQGVTSMDRAITMLGFDAVCNTVFVEAFTKKREGWDSPESLGAYSYVIKTSVTAAEVAKQLARHLKMPDPGTVTTAALIHQLGRMSLLSSEPVSYPALWKKRGAQVSIPPGIGREIVHYRTDYMRYGAELSRRWQLPPELTDSVRYHSDPERVEEPHRFLVAAVAVSQLAARSMFESDEDLQRDQGSERVEKSLRDLSAEFEVSKKEIQDLLNEAKRPASQKAEGIKLFPLR